MGQPWHGPSMKQAASIVFHKIRFLARCLYAKLSPSSQILQRAPECMTNMVTVLRAGADGCLTGRLLRSGVCAAGRCGRWHL